MAAPNILRAWHRRAVTRSGIAGGAAAAAAMHVAMFVVNALPRGVVGGVTAFFWQIVTIVPLTLMHVVAGMALGYVVSALLSSLALALRGRGGVFVNVLFGALGAAPFAAAAAWFAAPSLLLEADPRFIDAIHVLVIVVPALVGGAVGVRALQLARAYLAARTSA
jgi:hypothetical protein